jgi:tRNA 2-thiouridine synthesizing protein A
MRSSRAAIDCPQYAAADRLWPVRPVTCRPERDSLADMTEAVQLDLRGLRCPLPVLRAQKALRGLPAGAELVVLATDPGAVKDFAAFAEASGHRLLESTETDGMFRFRLEKRA